MANGRQGGAEGANRGGVVGEGRRRSVSKGAFWEAMGTWGSRRGLKMGRGCQNLGVEGNGGGGGEGGGLGGAALTCSPERRCGGARRDGVTAERRKKGVGLRGERRAMGAPRGGRHVGCVWQREPPCWVCIVLGTAMLGAYSTGGRHVECVWNRKSPRCSYRKPPWWVCIVLGTAMLDVYCTGSCNVGCLSHRNLPCWVCIVQHWEPPCYTLHSFKFD